MRLLYTSVTWCYITNTFAVPCSVLVPFIALVFGIYPLVLNRDFALASTLYFTASTLVTNVSDAGPLPPPRPPSSLQPVTTTQAASDLAAPAAAAPAYQCISQCVCLLMCRAVAAVMLAVYVFLPCTVCTSAVTTLTHC
jgi:hypothetical protein